MISRTPRNLPCHEPFDGFCDACGSADAECKDTHLGHICTECRKLCAYCEDWMMDDSGLVHDGKLMHIACALEAMDAERDANRLVLYENDIVPQKPTANARKLASLEPDFVEDGGVA